MSLGDPIVVTYNAVAHNLVKINQDNYTSVYTKDNTTERFTLKVSHSIPKKSGGDKESHTALLEVQHFDVDGVLIRTVVVWASMKTFDAKQDATATLYAHNALNGFMTAANATKLIARES